MNKLIPRRQFISTSAGLAASAFLNPLRAAESTRKMTACLSCGSIGVSANQREAVRLAQRYNFETVEAQTDFVAKLSDTQLNELLAEMKDKGVAFGFCGLPLEFRRDENVFSDGLKRLPTLAAGLARVPVKRWTTWLMPSDNARTYLENFKLHARRLREAAAILKDHGQRLGLEYVGTKTLRQNARYSFVHCLAELKELIAEIGTGNVGVVLDSWHWWQAEDTAADILSLKDEDVLSVDLNDAPAGVPKDKQVDGRRELPAATGVIDIAAFLKALQQIGYSGPVRAEPFNQALNALDNEEACAATSAALKKAFAQLG